MNKSLEDIAEKIQKLKAMAEGSSNQQEVETATGKLQALLYEYNLTMDDVNKYNPESNPIVYYEIPLVDGKNVPEWKNKLFSILAKSNLCEILNIARDIKKNKKGKVVNSKKTNRVLIFGKQVNIDNVLWTYNYVSSRLEEIAHNEYKKQNFCWDGRIWKRSFFAGAVSALYVRLNRQKKEFTDNPVNMAMTVRWNDEIKRKISDVITEQWDNKQTKKNNTVLTDAYNKGHETGTNLNLGRPIENEKLLQLSGG